MDEQRKQEEQRKLDEKRAREAPVRQRRQSELTQLNQDLPHLIGLAQGLQQELNSTDFETALPADLRQHARELDRLARQIRKRVENL